MTVVAILVHVRSAAIRIVTATVMILFSGLPVTALLCARECDRASSSAVTTAEHESHCHDADTGSTTTLSAVTAGACSMLTLAEAAPVVRTAALHRVASAPAELSHPLGGPMSLTSIPRSDSHSFLTVGLSPGARIPLRI